VQIKQSNRLSLFEKRLHIVEIFEGIYNLFENNQKLCQSQMEAEPVFSADFLIYTLTNNEYLYDLSNVVKDPKKEPERTNFLLKIVSIQKLANSIPLLFKRQEADYAKAFLLAYCALIHESFKYLVHYTELEKEAKDFKWSRHQIKQEAHESFKKLKQKFDKFDEQYTLIKNNNTLDKLKSQMKPIR